MTTQIKRMLGVAVLAAAASFAAGCAGTSGTTSAPDARGDFGSEARDPGMGDRGSTSGGAANIDGSFRTVYFDFDDYSLSSEAKNSPVERPKDRPPDRSCVPRPIETDSIRGPASAEPPFSPPEMVEVQRKVHPRDAPNSRRPAPPSTIWGPRWRRFAPQ